MGKQWAVTHNLMDVLPIKNRHRSTQLKLEFASLGCAFYVFLHIFVVLPIYNGLQKFTKAHIFVSQGLARLLAKSVRAG
jgi:hypothetical protein